MSADSDGSTPDLLRLRERLDAALEHIAREPEFDGVYLGPWWELPRATPPPSIIGWKRAVLRRVPGRGAEHWGHLFLVYSGLEQTTRLELDSGSRLRGPRYGVVRRVGQLSEKAALLIRPSHPDGSPLLDRFADEAFTLLQREANPEQSEGHE
jgi:hypothetical protein